MMKDEAKKWVWLGQKMQKIRAKTPRKHPFSPSS